jgi:hypothetical protein
MSLDVYTDAEQIVANLSDEQCDAVMAALERRVDKWELLECEAPRCQAEFHWHTRYATEAREGAASEGWTLVKGRGPNTYHDHCPDHAGEMPDLSPYV